MKLKKHISFLLTFFLLVSNIGFAVDVHYCGGKIASIKPVFWKSSGSIIEKEKGCCPPKVSDKNEKKASCCKDKVVHIQKKTENTTVKSFAFHSDTVFLLQEWKPIIFSEVSNFEGRLIASYYCDANAPPLFKLYHQYIFYA